MKFTRAAAQDDKKKIEALRICEFRRSDQFSLIKAEKLKWSQTDEESIVLVVLGTGHTAISTMRGTPVNTANTAENFIKCSITNDTRFPAMLFSSTATFKPMRKQGLNQLLRLYLIEYAMNHNIQTLISPVYKGAPRINFMKQLGYKFLTPEKNWQSKLLANSERQLALLTSEHFEHAIELIKQHYSNIIMDYPWAGTPLSNHTFQPVFRETSNRHEPTQ